MSLVIIQPTSFCNLNCQYCYVPNRKNKTVISIDAFEKILKELVASRTIKSPLDIQWHMGEPLAAGIEFYKKVARVIAKYNSNAKNIRQSFQTNGALVDQSWCHYFREHNASVGLSWDGPKFLHDHYRKNWSGQGSFEQVMRGFKILRDNKIRPGVLAVITAKTLDYPEEFLDFFVQNEVHWLGFNTEQIENSNKRSSIFEKDDVDDKYYYFIRRLFYAWIRVRDKIRIREFEDALNIIYQLKKGNRELSLPNECVAWNIVTIDKTGNVHTYSPEFAGWTSPEYNNFVLGNLLDQSFDEIVEGDDFSKLQKNANKSMELCRMECPYFHFCGGAFFSNKYAEHGKLEVTETKVCKLHVKTLVQAVLDCMTSTDLRDHFTKHDVSAPESRSIRRSQ